MALLKSNLVGIQYGGEAGITQACLDAVLRLIQYDQPIKEVRILSSGEKFGLFLTIHPNDYVAIKTGFSTGYPGEGPRKFSYLLQLLVLHKIEIDEYEVSRSIVQRLNNSALTKDDLKMIFSTKPVRPQRFYDYIKDQHIEAAENGTLWKSLVPTIPFTIIDNRIVDLAVSFWENPNDNIRTGYNRLEDILRERTASNAHGVELFTQSFMGNSPRLSWGNINKAEQIARANIFRDVYMAYRNARSHKEMKNHRNDYLSEFLLLNHLYRLEKEATA